MRVRELMTPDPLCVAPDTTVGQAKQIMEERYFRRLPVVAGERLVGIVTARDLGRVMDPPVIMREKWYDEYLLSTVQVRPA